MIQENNFKDLLVGNKMDKSLHFCNDLFNNN